MSVFDQAFDTLIGVEGGYSNNPADAGGETCWGITEAVARKHGYTGEMKDLPRDFAKSIYKSDYWDMLRLDGVALQSVPLANSLFDIAVNIGAYMAPRWFQKALNLFNRQGADYKDIPEDGFVGSGTLNALQSLLEKRGADGETVMLRAITCLKGSWYIQIGASRPANEDFEFGWFLNRIKIDG